MRHATLAFLAFLCIATAACDAAAKPDRMVQVWTPTAASVLKADTRLPTGDVLTGKLDIQNFAPDIRFDPRDLENSVILFSASFMPIDPPGHQLRDDAIAAQAASVFESIKIQEKDDNTFEVHGFFRMNGQQRQLIFTMSVVPRARKDQRPALVFSGQFNAPVGNMAPQLGLPAQIPVVFHIETVPAG